MQGNQETYEQLAANHKTNIKIISFAVDIS